MFIRHELFEGKMSRLVLTCLALSRAATTWLSSIVGVAEFCKASPLLNNSGVGKWITTFSW